MKNNPFEDSEISLRGLRRPARSSGALGAPSRSKLLHSWPVKNSRRPQRCFERTFSLGLAVWALQLAPPRVPRTPLASIFEPETPVFSRFLRAASVRRAKRPTSIKHWQERYKTHFGAVACPPKTLKNRSANASNCVGRCERRLRTFWEWPPELSERLWAALGTLLDGFWPFLASRGRPKIGLGAAFGCPKAVPSASGRVPATALGAQNGPRSIFHRFGVHLGWIFVDFRSSCVRRRHKSRISKRSRVILSARLGLGVAHSLRTARTSFEMTFEHCMFSLFSLRTHKLT